MIEDWIAALILVLVSVTVLAFCFRYGRRHLNFPWRLDRFLGRLALQYESLPTGPRKIATYRCNTCENTAVCDDWHEHGPDKLGYRAFCPNRFLINNLSESLAADTLGKIVPMRRFVQTDAPHRLAREGKGGGTA